MGDRETEALFWISRNEGLSPGNAISTQALALVKARGLAEPNQPARRKLQDDCWWLTDAGIACVRRAAG